MIILDLVLRLMIWFLLTSDLSVTNIVIGVAVALILPRNSGRSAPIREWLRTLWKSLLAIPQAYLEAIEIILRPHRYEEITQEHVSSRRTPGLIFLDIFIITFTPKTIVTHYHERGWYDVHWIRRRKPQ
ncbi:MAG: cation:proton antiporter [Oscillatoriales cyanobacterium]|nr:MAG: cation:proton antiporter [Oscillatoriales cyanobacterium]